MTNISDKPGLSLLGDSGRAMADEHDDIRGRRVVDSFGKEVGHVEDLLVDDEHLKVRFLVVAHGGVAGVGRRHMLVPVDAIVATYVGTVRIDRTHAHVSAGPGYDPELEPDLVDDGNHLDDVCRHYGTVPFWGVGYGSPYPYHPHRPTPR